MSPFATIQTTGFYSFLNGAECIIIGRPADASHLIRVEIASGTQIDLLDEEVVRPTTNHGD